MVYDEEYTGQITTHEVGHTFGMQHDQEEPACTALTKKYLMASSGNVNSRVYEWSPCSITTMQTRIDYLSCLLNEPYATEYAYCGMLYVCMYNLCML